MKKAATAARLLEWSLTGGLLHCTRSHRVPRRTPGWLLRAHSGMGLKALTAGVLLLAVALGVAQNRGLIPQDRLHQLQGDLLQQPAVAAAVARLRSVSWLEGLLPAQAGCACGVSAGAMRPARQECAAGRHCERLRGRHPALRCTLRPSQPKFC